MGADQPQISVFGGSCTTSTYNVGVKCEIKLIVKWTIIILPHHLIKPLQQEQQLIQFRSNVQHTHSLTHSERERFLTHFFEFDSISAITIIKNCNQIVSIISHRLKQKERERIAKSTWISSKRNGNESSQNSSSIFIIINKSLYSRLFSHTHSISSLLLCTTLSKTENQSRRSSSFHVRHIIIMSRRRSCKLQLAIICVLISSKYVSPLLINNIVFSCYLIEISDDCTAGLKFAVCCMAINFFIKHDNLHRRRRCSFGWSFHSPEFVISTELNCPVAFDRCENEIELQCCLHGVWLHLRHVVFTWHSYTQRLPACANYLLLFTCLCIVGGAVSLSFVIVLKLGLGASRGEF